MFHVLMVLCALSIFAIVALIAWELVTSSKLTWDKMMAKIKATPNVTIFTISTGGLIRELADKV